MGGKSGCNLKWTPEQDKLLTELVVSGLSYSHIASALNEEMGSMFTRNSAIGRANRIGLRGAQGSHPRPAGPARAPRMRRAPGAPNVFIKVKDTAPPLPNATADVTPKLVELTEVTGCRWPYGDADFRFCDHAKVKGFSYCPGHLALSINNTAPRPRVSWP